MFRCSHCGSPEFRLMLNPEFEGAVDIGVNEHQEVIIRSDEDEFIADLGFMNEFASCGDCEAVGDFEYYFPPENQKPTEGSRRAAAQAAESGGAQLIATNKKRQQAKNGREVNP